MALCGCKNHGDLEKARRKARPDRGEQAYAERSLREIDRRFRKAARVMLLDLREAVFRDLRRGAIIKSTPRARSLVNQIIDWDAIEAQSRTKFGPAYLSAVVGSGNDTIKRWGKAAGAPNYKGGIGSVSVVFDIYDPKAVEFGRKATAALVTRETARTKEQISRLVARSIKEGGSTRELGAEIKKIVGLNRPQEKRLIKFEQELWARTGAKKLKSAEIQKRVSNFRDKLLRQRGEMIAQTESTRAYAAARLLGFEQMGIQQVRFLANADACPICTPKNGTIYKVAEAAGVIPVHPLCRCSWIMVKGLRDLIEDDQRPGFIPTADLIPGTARNPAVVPGATLLPVQPVPVKPPAAPKVPEPKHGFPPEAEEIEPVAPKPTTKPKPKPRKLTAAEQKLQQLQAAGEKQQAKLDALGAEVSGLKEKLDNLPPPGKPVGAWTQKEWQAQFKAGGPYKVSGQEWLAAKKKFEADLKIPKAPKAKPVKEPKLPKVPTTEQEKVIAHYQAEFDAAALKSKERIKGRDALKKVRDAIDSAKYPQKWKVMNDAYQSAVKNASDAIQEAGKAHKLLVEAKAGKLTKIPGGAAVAPAKPAAPAPAPDAPKPKALVAPTSKQPPSGPDWKPEDGVYVPKVEPKTGGSRWDLDERDRSAIRFWVGNGYETIRPARIKATKGVALSVNERQVLSDFEKAIANNYPKFKGTVYRGIGGLSDEAFEAALNGKFQDFDTWASSATKRTVAGDFIGYNRKMARPNNNVYYIIRSKTGRDIRDFNPAEAEVVIQPGTKYKVVSVRKNQTCKNRHGDILPCAKITLQEI